MLQDSSSLRITSVLICSSVLAIKLRNLHTLGKCTHYGKYFSMELLSIHNKDVCKMSRQTIGLKGDHVQRTILLAFRPKQILCLQSESVTTYKLQKDISSLLPGTLRTMRRSWKLKIPHQYELHYVRIYVSENYVVIFFPMLAE